MRKPFFVLFVLFGAMPSIYAQECEYGKALDDISKALLYGNINYKLKSEIVPSRLVSIVTDLYYGGEYKLNDSLRMRYTGNRGITDKPEEWDYDISNEFLYSRQRLDSTYRYTKYYDAENKLTSKVSREWYMGNWRILDSIVCDYNGKTVTGWTRWVLVNNVWTAVYRISYSYNDDKTIKTTLYKRWNDTVWVTAWKYAFEYNQDKEIIEERSEIYDNSKWKPSLRYVYSYYGNSRNVKEARFERFLNNNWEVYSHDTYEYGTNNKVTCKINAYWDESIKDWDHESANLYKYNINSKAEEVIYTYKRNGKPRDTISREVMAYNVHNQILSSAFSVWHSNIREFVVIDGSPNRMWFYEEYDPGIPKKETSVLLYPVPAHKQLHLAIDFERPEDFAISIISIDGKLMLQNGVRATASYKYTFDTSRFAQGNYLFIITTASRKICKTICIAGDN